VNAAIGDLSIGRLGVVVIDELHMVDDESRGYILELMSTKLLSLEQKVQIIGESSQGIFSCRCLSTGLVPRTLS
jgi:superfamily II helicase